MKFLLKLALVASLVFGSSAVFAQKFGCVDSQDLVTVISVRDSVELKIQRLSNDYATHLELIQVEFNNKYQDYQKNLSTYSESMRQLKEKELQNLEQRYTETAREAQQELQNYQVKLMTPIVDEIKAAVKKVGSANNFLIVFDLSGDTMLYFDEKNLVNITPLVKKELGLK